MFRFLTFILLAISLGGITGVTYANESSKNPNSLSLEPLTIEDEILMHQALGRAFTLDGLRFMCINAHPVEKDELTILFNKVVGKHSEFVEKYIKPVFDVTQNKKPTKLPKVQAEKLGEESYIWGLEYLKKNGITNESPSLKSCSESIKNFPLVP